MTASPATIEEWVGTVGEIHARDPFEHGALDHPVIVWCRPTDDALVLGSRQDDDLVDHAACAAAGLEVVRRRSGGGAVVVRRDEMLWVDVLLPADMAPDDVRGSMLLVGETWRDALEPVVGRAAVVHRGGMVDTPWSQLVCFAGVGPGELLVRGAKLVGVSQRRSRHGVRAQGLVHLGPPVDRVEQLLRGELPPGAPDAVADLGGTDPRAVVERLAARITHV